MRFQDRADAGRRLAEPLAAYRDTRPIVLALAPGGVPVGAEVARALGAPLEPLVARELGAPQCPEFAIGAIAEGGGAYVDPDALLEAGLRDEDVEAIAGSEGAELARRVRLYRAGRPLPDLRGRTVLVVDDGVATGATAHAAARAARAAGAARVVLAAPAIPAERAPDLRADFDALVAVEYLESFVAPGAAYERFAPVGEDEALALLAQARAAPPRGGAAPDRGSGDPPRGQASGDPPGE